jgi:hypothetical protein
MPPLTEWREREKRAAVGFWFAVQRMLRRKTEPPWPAPPDTYPPGDTDPGDDSLGARVPRQPPDSSGSAATAEPEGDMPASGDIQRR